MTFPWKTEAKVWLFSIALPNKTQKQKKKQKKKEGKGSQNLIQQLPYNIETDHAKITPYQGKYCMTSAAKKIEIGWANMSVFCHQNQNHKK